MSKKFKIFDEEFELDLGCSDCEELVIDLLEERVNDKVEDALYSFPDGEDSPDPERIAGLVSDTFEEDGCSRVVDELTEDGGSQDEEGQTETTDDDDDDGSVEDADDDGSGEQEGVARDGMADLIKTGRNEAGLSVEELAEEVPATPQLIKQMEAGKIPIPDDLVSPLIEALDLDVEQIIEGLKGSGGGEASTRPEEPTGSQMGDPAGPQMDSQEGDGEGAEDAVEVVDEVIELVGDIRQVNPDYDHRGKSVQDIKKDYYEEFTGEQIEDLSEKKQRKIEDRDGYLDAMIDDVRDRLEEETAEDGGAEGHRPNPARKNGTGSAQDADGDKVTDEKLQEWRDMHANRDEMRKNFGRSPKSR